MPGGNDRRAAERNAEGDGAPANDNNRDSRYGDDCDAPDADSDGARDAPDAAADNCVHARIPRRRQARTTAPLPPSLDIQFSW